MDCRVKPGNDAKVSAARWRNKRSALCRRGPVYVAAQRAKTRRKRRKDQRQHVPGRGQRRAHDSARADRTVFAAERTYAAWVRTGLLAMASGIGAKALLEELLPQWLIIATGSVLVLFSAFCFGAAVWRHLSRRAATANRCVAHPALDVDRREWISRARSARRSRRHLVRPKYPIGLMPPLRRLGDGWEGARVD
jgi:uncharacterized membrane protein YidH (DUF202 family)